MRFDSYGGLALLTDLYQLTMAYGYWKIGRAERGAVFHLFFRHLPFRGGYAIAAGLGPILQYLDALRFESSDLDYLATLIGNDGQRLFEPGFLDYLAEMRWTCDIDAMPEGTLVFANEPMLRVTGPIIQCQLLETALLNLINFPTLVATKAARICQVAGSDAVLEFGLRRAQGPDSGMTASRAAYIGGCAATSNVLAGKQFGIPVKGTHAHSWVMAFDDELEAFEQYALAMPNNCVFLVDTYDTLAGVQHACRVGAQLQQRGHRMVGIRLDSGDLAYLSIEARKILDQAGFTDAVIVASNELDEHVMESLKHQGSPIAVWGVGTKLVTAFDQPALGGVYKLAATQDAQGQWEPRMKLSEQSAKTSIPGILQVRRFADDTRMVADMIYDQKQGVDTRFTIVDPADRNRTRHIEPQAGHEDLLQAVVRKGQVVAEPESLERMRTRAKQQLSQLHASIRRLLNPHQYPVGLDVGLAERRQEMICNLATGK